MCILSLGVNIWSWRGGCLGAPSDAREIGRDTPRVARAVRVFCAHCSWVVDPVAERHDHGIWVDKRTIRLAPNRQSPVAKALSRLTPHRVRFGDGAALARASCPATAVVVLLAARQATQSV